MQTMKAGALAAGVVAASVAVSIAESARAQDAVQWRVEDGGNGHWYALYDDGADFTWHASALRAQELGGYLATLVTPDEDSFVRASFAPTASSALGPWLGGLQDVRAADYSEPAGGWTWITDEPWIWALWDRANDAEPNNAQCGPENFLHLALDVPEGRWNDVGDFGCFGSGLRGAIIEWSADCNADGIVDFGQIRAGELADANGNNIPDCCEDGSPCAPCVADVIEDGAVNGVDLAAVINAWGTDGGKLPRTDIDRNGVVDGADLAILLSSWGTCG
jgi:hypothetical protein